MPSTYELPRLLVAVALAVTLALGAAGAAAQAAHAGTAVPPHVVPTQTHV